MSRYNIYPGTDCGVQGLRLPGVSAIGRNGLEDRISKRWPKGEQPAQPKDHAVQRGELLQKAELRHRTTEAQGREGPGRGLGGAIAGRVGKCVRVSWSPAASPSLSISLINDYNQLGWAGASPVRQYALEGGRGACTTAQSFGLIGLLGVLCFPKGLLMEVFTVSWSSRAWIWAWTCRPTVLALSPTLF